MTEPEIIERPAATALARLDPQVLIEKAIEAGAAVETMERLLAMAKEVREIQAREAWYQAMADFQARCPAIMKTATARIQTSRGAYSYTFAPLDEITSTIQPIMGPLGLSVSWRSKIDPDKVIVSCRISHTLGHHEESGDIAMPIVARAETGEGAMGANPAQRVGIALTYAKRYALLGIIGMAPEDDDDAEGMESGQPSRAEGGSSRSLGQRPAQRPAQNPEQLISENQVTRFSAIARGQNWTDDQVHELLSASHYNSRKEIRVNDYDAIVDRLKGGYAAWQQRATRPAQQGTLT